MGSFKLKMHHNRFSAGAAPQTLPGDYDDPLIGWTGGHLSPFCIPLSPSASRSRFTADFDPPPQFRKSWIHPCMQ